MTDTAAITTEALYTATKYSVTGAPDLVRHRSDKTITMRPDTAAVTRYSDGSIDVNVQGTEIDGWGLDFGRTNMTWLDGPRFAGSANGIPRLTEAPAWVIDLARQTEATHV